MNRATIVSTHGTPQALAAPMPSRSDITGATPVLRSAEVLQGRSSVAIEHNGAVYRLQTTRQGKLILTK
jgi:hemin uptake protein HemP